jgi:glycosyltransferase involved in cell wall biosynthesis
MIVRDEEKHLGDCLQGAAGLAKEIIVVDTGSRDRTKEIALHHGARVYDFNWIDDFAAARNESVRHATGSWIFWLDADDRIDEANQRRLLALFRSLGDQPAGYLMRYSCWFNHGSLAAHRMFVDQVRLFPNHPQVRWAHRVHELILPAVQQIGGTPKTTDVVIEHLGYQDEVVCRAKDARNLRLLRMEQEEYPEDPATLFNLGWTLLNVGNPAAAVPLLRRVENEVKDKGAKVYELLAQAYRDLGQLSEAVQACERGRHLFPGDPTLLSCEGLLLYRLGDFRRASEFLEYLLREKPRSHIAEGMEDGLTSFFTRHNLAIVYRDHGRFADAETQWRQALEERPNWGQALLGLGELYLVQNRWEPLNRICRQLDSTAAGKREADELRARGHLARKEYVQARRILEKMTADWPQLLWPKVHLSRALLQQGRDWTAAEKALRAVLALDPAHKEATHNLNKLLANHQQSNQRSSRLKVQRAQKRSAL